MQQVLSLALKDLKLVARDRMGLFFIVGFPILMGLFFGLVMGGPSTGSGSGKISIVLIDQDQTDQSAQFVSSLKAIENLNVELGDDVAEAQQRVRKGQVVAMVVLSKGFGERAGILWGEPPQIQLGLDPSRNSETAMLQRFVMQAIGDLVGSRFQNP